MLLKVQGTIKVLFSLLREIMFFFGGKYSIECVKTSAIPRMRSTSEMIIF